MNEYCRECWCDCIPPDCPHVGVERVGGRWLCRSHAEDERRRSGRYPSIRCPRCGMRSFNPNDVREKYCGNCHQYHDTMPATLECPTCPGLVTCSRCNIVRTR